MATIHYNRSHTNQDVIFDGATMNDCIVSNRNIASYDCFVLFVRTVNYRAILNVDPSAYPNTVDIATNDCIEPNAAFLAHYNVANNRGCWANIAAFGNLRRKTSNGENIHNKKCPKRGTFYLIYSGTITMVTLFFTEKIEPKRDLMVASIVKFNRASYLRIGV